MSKIIFLFVLSFGIMGVANAQETMSTIRGKVNSSQSGTSLLATLLLKKSTDQSVVKINTTDSTGAFEFTDILFGKYILLITCSNYDSLVSKEFEVNAASIELPTFELKKAQDVVQVVAKRKLIEQKLGVTLINVDKSVSAMGSSALEILDKSPGVSIDRDGKITLKGKEGVLVYIDGKPSYLSVGDLANMLRDLPASQLEQLEIMSNPPARYGASGNGVINIKTKKSKSKGYNGVFTTSYLQGTYHGSTQSINLNYRNNKFNFFGSLLRGDRKGFQEFDIIRNFRDENTNALTSIFDQETLIKNKNASINGKLGVDYSINKSNTIGLYVGAYHNPKKAYNFNNTLLKNPNNTINNRIDAPASTDGYWHNAFSNFNYRHNFSKAGQEISFDADYIWYGAAHNQLFSNYFFDAANNPSEPTKIFKMELPRYISITSFKVDYIHPITSASKIEVGYRSSFVKTDNDASFWDVINNVWAKNNTLSNRFIYKENINATYINYTQKWSKWEAQLGLRGEHTNLSGNQATSNQKFKKNYVNLFPTGFLNYTVNDNHKLGVTLGRRIERPDYKALNPFKFYLDRYTYEEGNPDLNPQYSHNIELSHFFKEGLLTTNITFGKTNGIIQDVVFQNNITNETYEKPSNLNNRRVVGINVNSEIPAGDNVSINLYAELNNNKYSGYINNKPFSLEANTFVGNASVQLKFAKSWSAELDGAYTSKSIEGTYIRNPYGELNMAIGKTILNKKGSIRLSGTDLLYTNKFSGYSRYQNVDILVRNNWQSRTLRLVFTYRFNKGLKTTQRSITTPIERERVKSESN